MRLGYKRKYAANIFIDLCLTTLLIAIVYIVVKTYIDQEKFIYSWDYIGYQKNTDILIKEFRKSFADGLLDFLASIFSDYSKLFCIPILPIYIALGESRFSFILSITLVYLISFSLVIGAVFSKLVSGNRWIAFWLAAFVTILTPSAWISLLRGYPDMGGASIFMLGILLYWRDTNLKSKRQSLQISYLMSALVIFRRHFAYAFRSFIITVLIQNLILFFLGRLNKEIKTKSNLPFILKRISLILIVFLGLSVHLLVKIFYFNYRELYASYEESFLRNIEYYGSSFGWLFIALAVIGYSISLFQKRVNKEKISFIILLGIVSSLQWISSSKQLGVHYVNHFLPFIVLGLSLCIWSLTQSLKNIEDKLKGYIYISLLVVLLTTNIFISLGNLNWSNQYSQVLFSRREAPLFRSDYPELRRFVNYFRDNTTSDEPIYVAASSYEILNKSILEELENQFYENKTLNIIRTSDIDSRDFYPINGLLDASYVIVTDPMQYHINPKEQKVIRVVGDIFRNSLLIANDFKRIDEKFLLDKDVTAYVYKRIRNTSTDTILSTLRFMENKINRKLGRETYWLTLNSGQTTVIERDALFKTTHISPLSVRSRFPASLLYFGEISKTTKVNGKINIMSDCSKINSILLHAKTLDSDRTLIEEKILSYVPKSQMPFNFTLDGKDVSFIELDLESQNNSKPSSTCMIALNHVVVSK